MAVQAAVMLVIYRTHMRLILVILEDVVRPNCHIRHAIQYLKWEIEIVGAVGAVGTRLSGFTRLQWVS